MLWGTSGTCDLLSYDLVVHLGLGVYDSRDVLLLERGAYNERRGLDALGRSAGHTLDAGAPQVLLEPRMAANVTALATPAGTGSTPWAKGMMSPAQAPVWHRQQASPKRGMAHRARISR